MPWRGAGAGGHVPMGSHVRGPGSEDRWLGSRAAGPQESGIRALADQRSASVPVAPVHPSGGACAATGAGIFLQACLTAVEIAIEYGSVGHLAASGDECSALIFGNLAARAFFCPFFSQRKTGSGASCPLDQGVGVLDEPFFLANDPRPGLGEGFGPSGRADVVSRQIN
jgi:hypothetical protein